jgi:hypothetical protein
MTDLTSWKSAVRGLVILGGRMREMKIMAEEVAKEVKKEDKKKLRTSLKFIKYIIKNI